VTIDCPRCPDGGYDSEGPRGCCGLYVLACEDHDPPVEWVEQTGVRLPTGGCLCGAVGRG
jgi:hypothetical protein